MAAEIGEAAAAGAAATGGAVAGSHLSLVAGELVGGAVAETRTSSAGEEEGCGVNGMRGGERGNGRKTTRRTLDTGLSNGK